MEIEEEEVPIYTHPADTEQSMADAPSVENAAHTSGYRISSFQLQASDFSTTLN